MKSASKSIVAEESPVGKISPTKKINARNSKRVKYNHESYLAF
jgi:hypothetical protein